MVHSLIGLEEWTTLSAHVWRLGRFVA